jgi:hypothetical protein
MAIEIASRITAPIPRKNPIITTTLATIAFPIANDPVELYAVRIWNHQYKPQRTNRIAGMPRNLTGRLSNTILARVEKTSLKCRTGFNA